MKKWVGWVLLAVSLWVTYQGWQNSQAEPRTEDMSKPVACQGREGCTVDADRPQELRTDFLGRSYTWKTSGGPVKVACARAYVFAGEWTCTAAPAS
ncbi:hypothetical protein [Paraliomyxa miuraensis]|uniref:hypothetical protein n=1 Tax=Paraliomyxa miuraensis TaxID=376150 RepID=UPI00225C2496|nr:hypothetical protein [Paraliomyxa miuraensis]MCX4246491.1 hypothetical protein [Paraliomyxa miuraensis]